LYNNTTYYWQVRSINQAGITYANGNLASFWSFTTSVSPASDFSKTAPTNGATDVSINSLLQWESSQNASEYQFCYDSVIDGECNLWTSTGTLQQAQIGGLQYSTVYEWQVKAINAAGTTFANGSPSSVWTFTTTALTDPADLVISPSLSSCVPGQDIDLDIDVHSPSRGVDGVAAYINFNPTYLTVLSVTSGYNLPTIIENSVDNQAGQINFSVGAMDNFPSGNFSAGTISLKCIAQTPGTELIFNQTLPRKSDITSSGISILGSITNALIKISNSAILNGNVNLQGRPVAPDQRWVTPLQVTLTVQGAIQPAYIFNPISDPSGNFVLNDIIPGTYIVRVKNSHTLSNAQTVTLAEGANHINFGTLLEGDADGNDYITIVDFSILVSTYGKCVGISSYDDRSDFNEDSCVNLTDFSWLVSNYGKVGGGSSTQSEFMKVASQSSVTIQIDPPAIQSHIGDKFTVTIRIQAGSQLVDGVQVCLDFDPTKLRIVQVISINNGLPLSIQNKIDNSKGAFDYAVGAFSNFPSGNLGIVQVQFEAIGVTTGTPITFHHGVDNGLSRDTDVTFAGSSILTGDSPGLITVTGPDINKVYIPIAIK
jgi:hypothetical protein